METEYDSEIEVEGLDDYITNTEERIRHIEAAYYNQEVEKFNNKRRRQRRETNHKILQFGLLVCMAIFLWSSFGNTAKPTNKISGMLTSPDKVVSNTRTNPERLVASEKRVNGTNKIADTLVSTDAKGRGEKATDGLVFPDTRIAMNRGKMSQLEFPGCSQVETSECNSNSTMNASYIDSSKTMEGCTWHEAVMAVGSEAFQIVIEYHTKCYKEGCLTLRKASEALGTLSDLTYWFGAITNYAVTSLFH